MHEWILLWMSGLGLPPDAAGTATDLAEVALLAAAAWVSHVVANRVILRVIHKIVATTRSDWDDRLVRRGVFRRLSHIVPALVVHSLAPIAFTSRSVVEWTQRGADIYAILAALTAVNLVITVAHEIYREYEISRRFPIRVYVQVMRILLAAAAVITCISILADQSPLLLLSGLGAMTAVLLLISKDSIQGLLAGIQLVSNDMVRPGDWVEIPQYGADGDVIDITLHTVKVRNWDNTITTIPTYSLIAESFKNWRGMSESGGRRIKRSLFLDVSSVKFCTPEMIGRFEGVEVIREYVEAKRAEVEEFNRTRNVDDSVAVNGRRLTNLGVFRQYVVGYLQAHPMINQELTLIVRQLQPTDHGLPLEIYAFSADKNWTRYEGIQSDIFDHLLAALPEFGLRVFQMPSGHDAVRAFGQLRSATGEGTVGDQA